METGTERAGAFVNRSNDAGEGGAPVFDNWRDRPLPETGTGIVRDV